MRFVYELTIPANTLSTAPEELKVGLITGTLKKISIGFPPGCAAMVKVLIRDKEFHISPINPDSYHAWDGYNETFDMNYELSDPSPVLTLVGWSDGTTYQHVITFRFDVSPVGELETIETIQAMLSAPLGFRKVE